MILKVIGIQKIFLVLNVFFQKKYASSSILSTFCPQITFLAL